MAGHVRVDRQICTDRQDTLHAGSGTCSAGTGTTPVARGTASYRGTAGSGARRVSLRQDVRFVGGAAGEKPVSVPPGASV